MISSSRARHFVFIVVLALTLTPLLMRAQSTSPKPITLDDYAKIKRISGAAISTDGKWMLYTVTPNDGDGTLVVKALDGDKVYEVPRGTGASFSDNARWVGYFIAPPAATGRGGRGGSGRGGGQPAQGAAAGAEAAPARTFEVLDLSTGTQDPVPFGGQLRLLARRRVAAAAAAGRRHPRRPPMPPAGRGGRGGAAGGSGGRQQRAGHRLADAAPRHRQPAVRRQRRRCTRSTTAGKQMAYTVRGQQRLGNGVYVMTLASGDQRMLDAAAADYDQLAWSAEGANLAVLRGDKAEGQGCSVRTRCCCGGTSARHRRRPRRSIRPRRRRCPSGMVVSEFTAPRWSTDGARVLVGLKEQDAEKPASTEPQANVDVWHWKDDEPQSVQIVQLNQERRATKAAVVDVASGSLRQIADDDMTTITPTDDLQWAIGRARHAVPRTGRVGRNQERHLPREPHDRRPHAHRAGTVAHDGTVAGREVVPVSEGRPRLLVRDGDGEEDGRSTAARAS